MSVLLGMRGTGSWSNEERPKRFREGILKLFPNGDVPLTAIMSKGRSRKVDDPEFKWFSKDLADQGGTITVANVFKDSLFASAYGAETAAAGVTVYVKCTEAIADHFRVGHNALILKAEDDGVESYGKVVAVDKNGASSYVAVKLLVASASGYLAAATYIDIVGNSNAEGSNIPDALGYDVDKFSNLTQIFRTALDITRTQRLTRMRTGDPYQEAKTESLLYHGIEMEMAGLFGYKSETTGGNGQKERTTEGMVTFIRNNQSDHVLDFPSSTALSWLGAGEDFIDEKLELLFRYGRDTKMALCGSGALLGIMKLVKQSGQFSLTAETGAYGVKVVRWVTPFGEIMLKRHPLFSFRSHRQNSMVMFEPENCQFSYISDTRFKKDDGQSKAGYTGYDGTKEEYLTEGGFEFHFPKTFMYLTGVGEDGTA